MAMTATADLATDLRAIIGRTEEVGHQPIIRPITFDKQIGSGQSCLLIQRRAAADLRTRPDLGRRGDQCQALAATPRSVGSLRRPRELVSVTVCGDALMSYPPSFAVFTGGNRSGTAAIYSS